MRTLLLPTPGHPGVLFFRALDSGKLRVCAGNRRIPWSTSQQTEEEDDDHDRRRDDDHESRAGGSWLPGSPKRPGTRPG